MSVTPSPAVAEAASPTLAASEIEEVAASSRAGGGIAVVCALAVLGGVAGAIAGGVAELPVVAVAAGLVALVGFVVSWGLTLVAPNQVRVLQVLGASYVGTLHTEGLRWVNPLTTRAKVSTRIRNHDTGVAKVNDADGNPIEISAVVVWRVEDAARAVLGVDDFVEFVEFQTEAAVRHIAGNYPYDVAGRTSLRDNADEITAELSAEIDERVRAAGVRIIESRINRLSYAPEIAQAMLRRQQAGAIVAAREQIVAGAVGMVQLALRTLEEEEVVELDEERKAAMVSNLLVVLCGDRDTQPVVNAGSLY